jgi:DNA-binding response OmpR family regulator
MNDLPSRTDMPARVLVVDDEDMPRMTMTRALNLMGYRADDAASGADALARLGAGCYDVMLLDLRMPGMDGVAVMQQARTLCPETLVIVLTAHASLDSAIAAVQHGATNYLLKPFSLQDTELAIRHALERRALAVREQPRPAPTSLVTSGAVTLDLATRGVSIVAADGNQVRQAELTGHEAALLAHLMHTPETVFSCRQLARLSLDYDVTEREAEEIIRPHMSRLRNKIEFDPAHPLFIRTVRGKGYLFSTV